MTNKYIINALLLDLDGTLADSLFVMRLVYNDFLTAHKCKPRTAEFNSLNGPPISEVIMRLKINHSLLEEYSVLLSRYCDLLDRVYLKVKPASGAVCLLRKAKENDCSIGIVTSNSKERTYSWLENSNLREMVDVIVSSDDVEKGKPNPEPYNLALKKLGLNSSHAIAIEDSPQGAHASMAAGLRTFALSFSKFKNWPQGVKPIKSLSQARQLIWGP